MDFKVSLKTVAIKSYRQLTFFKFHNLVVGRLDPRTYTELLTDEQLVQLDALTGIRMKETERKPIYLEGVRVFLFGEEDEDVDEYWSLIRLEYLSYFTEVSKTIQEELNSPTAQECKDRIRFYEETTLSSLKKGDKPRE